MIIVNIPDEHFLAPMDFPAAQFRQQWPFNNRWIDPAACSDMREAARVLKPGGRFVFNVRDKLERNDFSKAVHEAVAQIFPDDPPRFLEVPYSYHDLSAIVGSLQQVEFGTIEIVVQPRESKASNPRQVAMGLVAGSSLANQVAERGSLSLEDATAAVEDVISQKFGFGSISAPMQAFQISACLPLG